MARTYRRKNQPIPRWVTHELRRLGDSFYWEYFPIDRDSREYANRVAKFRSDAGTTSFREPGPAWFRNLFTERPQRREAKRQIRKYMMDEEFEIQLLDKNPLMYWT